MPTLEEVGAALEKADAAGDTDGARELAGYYRDLQAQQPQPGAIGKIMNAFGYNASRPGPGAGFAEGAKQAFGIEPVATPSTALSDQTVQSMKAAGIFHDYTKGQGSFLQDIAEGVIRTGAAGLELASRTGAAAIGGVLGAAAQQGENFGIRGLKGEEGIVGAATDPGIAMLLGVPPEVEAANAIRANNLHVDLARAGANGIIGGTEANFHGTVPPAPEVKAAQEQAVQAVGAANPEPPPARPTITAHLSGKLIEAGRPEDEANAAAAIVQSHYETRSERFSGALGTPEEMYVRDFATVEKADKGGRGYAAQGKTVLRDGRDVITLFGKADASTFIHETGHLWLNELDKDAQHELAPDQLKSDVATVRKWAGAPETGDIPTSAHEKFARGFERYMMEGKAPAKGLQPIFDQFKQWLTKIYLRVGNLKSPITDDIRSVFDRMIAGDQEKAAEAQTQSAAPSIHDIHESEAETIAPERSQTVADNMRDEIERTTQKQAPEIADEIRTGQTPAPARTGEPSGVSAPGESLPGRGGEISAPEADIAKPAPVTESRNQVAPEGARPQTGATVQPNIRLEGEAQHIDKAGNIRLDNLNSTEDVNATLREFADKNDQFIAARRGIVTDQEVIEYAEANGLSTSDVNIDRLRAMSVEDGVPLAARILGGRQMLVQSAEAVHAAMQGADELAYAEVAQRHLRLQETLSGITAEWGRAGRAFRMLGEDASKAQELSQFLKANTGKTLFQIKREMEAGKRLDSPAKVSGFLRDAAKPSYGEMLLEAFKNWLISGPITHTMYSLGNKVYALYRAFPETAVRAAVGAVHEAIAGEPIDRVYFGELRANAYAMFYGQRNGLRAMVDSFKAGQTAALPGEGSVADLARQRALSEKLSGPELAARIEELKQNPTPNMLKALAEQGPTTGFTNTKAIPGIAGTIIRFPGERMVAPLHAFDRAVGYEVAKAHLIYRQAVREGLEGDALTARVADLQNNVPEEITAQAREEATENALLGKAGRFTQRFGQWIRWEAEMPVLGRTQPLSFIEPFVNIGSVIDVLALVDRTPLGLLSRRIRDDLKGGNGTLAQDTAIAMMGLGTAVAGTAAGLKMQGVLNGSPPTDRNEAAMAMMTQGLPHSIIIGETSYQLNRLGVVGMQLSVAADMYTVANAAEQGEFSRAAGLLVHSISQNFLDEGFASGLSDLLRAVEDSDRYGESYIRNLVSTAAVPFSVGMTQLAKTVDPYAREARTLTDSMLAKIPFASEGLYARRDIWGEKVPNNQFVGVYARDVQNDPVNQALLRVGTFPAFRERRIRNVQLTDQQYDEYQQIFGRLTKRALANVVQMPGFDQQPLGAQEELLKKTWEDGASGTGKQAADRMMMMYPKIYQDSMNLKVEKATAGTPTAQARRAGLR